MAIRVSVALVPVMPLTHRILRYIIRNVKKKTGRCFFLNGTSIKRFRVTFEKRTQKELICNRKK